MAAGPQSVEQTITLWLQGLEAKRQQGLEANTWHGSNSTQEDPC